MSEFLQENKEAVNLKEYDDGKPWKASAEDIVAAYEKAREEDDKSIGSFTLRLLDPEGSGAFDRFVQVVAVDSLGAENPIFVSVRPLKRDGTPGKLEPYSVVTSGLIIKDDTPDSEAGYFVGGPGTGGDQLQNLVMKLRTPNPVDAIELRALPLE